MLLGGMLSIVGDLILQFISTHADENTITNT